MDPANEAATVRHATKDLPQRHRVSSSRERLSDFLIEIELKPDHPVADFDSMIVARSLRDLQLLKVTFTAAQIVRRTGGGECSGYFLMHVNLSGRVAVSSMGRQLTLQEGEAVLLDGAQPFTIHRQEAGSSYVVRISRGRMAQLVFLAETIVMRRLSSATGSSRLFTACLDAVLLHADRASALVRQLTYKHITDLLAVLLRPGEARAAGVDSPGLAADEDRGLSGMRFQTAKAYIVERAQDQISIREVADHLGITERHLQRLFERNGTTFTAFLNEVRLGRAHAMLCDRDSDKLQIRSICFKTGFRDVSHFNRVFRARYGCTPAEVRKTRCGGTPTL
jgi:AraC-like DNA-binding protein